MTMIMNGRVCVYRLFGQDGTLLYIGKTGNLAARRRQHAASKPWWLDVWREEVQWYATREQAGVAEERAILAEQPKYVTPRESARADQRERMREIDREAQSQCA